MDRYSTLREIARRQYTLPELYISAEPYDFCVIGDSVTRDYHFCQKCLWVSYKYTLTWWIKEKIN